jgi:hypothetical protein
VTGQQLAYVLCESEPGRRSAAKLLSNDEARRISQAVPPVADDLSLVPDRQH